MAKQLNIDLLRTFHAVARFGRFNEAAEHVHRSASTVTTQIQKLEDQVGQRLFSRSNQGVDLTLYGRKLLGETTEFLKSHDRLLISLMPQRMQGKIRLGVPDTYAPAFIQAFVPRLIADNPLLELEIEARTSGELLNLFTANQLDLAITVSAQPLAQGERLGPVQPLWVAAEQFSYPPNAPLPITVPIAGCPYRAAALQALKDHGIYHRVLLESPNSSAVEACVRSGVAVGLMEESRMGEGLRQMTELAALPAQHLYLLCDTANALALHVYEQVRHFRV
ncbi:LysR family transcriptional regulator [Pseudomonas fluorescens]|jgi:DNA-binding transcriptional LysR family regulator|uniref:LysR family transcriptional regulator n=1 Tax=Pseudomonas TaxID=286 RepID=UPI0008126A2A|nr:MULTISPECIES: LysR family transcriptional regulator [Pseudomonas]MBD8100252.1 LysR family transcriptional regulator [Pseudomonas fluorescens]MBD8776168.1 LysR family transcriptional regulator [Pseudomonas fluorescens]MBD8781950.1 LysR family transcriptional regulator [Pseudomonas fluorescens]MBD8797852.1 LysR family transcriptional regulator [Pseudomonas fluorescens]TKK28088.1 LysR family transcriptional regulator [Pseudomonas sp. CFBP13528]